MTVAQDCLYSGPMTPTSILTVDKALHIIEHLNMSDKLIRNMVRDTPEVLHQDGTPWTQEERDMVIEYYSGHEVQDTLRQYIVAVRIQEGIDQIMKMGGFEVLDKAFNDMWDKRMGIEDDEDGL